MQQQTQPGDLKALCSETLQALRPNVTPKDKKDAREELNISRQTIEEYLKGNVNKVDVAMSLIDFFQPIVLARLQKLQFALA